MPNHWKLGHQVVHSVSDGCKKTPNLAKNKRKTNQQEQFNYRKFRNEDKEKTLSQTERQPPENNEGIWR